MNAGEQRVEVSPGVVFREVGGEAVLLDLRSHRYYSLDPVGTRMWALLVELGSTAAVAERLVGEFEVDAETLDRDLRALVEKLAAEGLLTVEG
jgi:hypothetical protein